MRLSRRTLGAVLVALALFATACGGSNTGSSPLAAAEDVATAAPLATEVAMPQDDPTTVEDAPFEPAATVATDDQQSAATSTAPCEQTAALFVTRGSANPTLVDPEVNATCADGVLTVTSNSIPDYTYIRTSPGDPNPQDLSFAMPATPVATTDYTAVPAIGAVAVALNGVPIYGPTEGQGGDVLSLGALSECGSHNGPGGFHLHLFSTSTTTDCIYTPDEVAEAPQLFGYAFDGYPIYTGNDQYTSSWVLTDESLFATNTWLAHTYVEGSGDLDECNGLTDADGNYAYYTTDTFPYVIGCFAGEVDLQGPGADRPGDAGGPAGDEGAADTAGEAAGPGGAGGGADFTEAAATLGVSLEELQAALGEPPPDFEAAAAALGITVEELEAVLPEPPGR